MKRWQYALAICWPMPGATLSRHDRAGRVRLSAHSPIPLMADEAIESVTDSFALAQMGAASIFALKIATYGALCPPLIIFK